MSVLTFASDDDREREAEERARARFLALLGPLRRYLDEPDVTNVNVNGDGAIFVERFGSIEQRVPETMPRGRRQALIRFLASSADRAIDGLHPKLASDMPWFDVRCQAFCPPVSDWPLALRRHAARVFTLDEYVQHGILSHEHRAALGAAARRKDNVLIAGAMGTGKSTLLNGYLNELATAYPHLRMLVIQDLHEVKASHENTVYLQARVPVANEAAHGTVTYDFPDVLEDALRMSGRLLAWSELRDGLSAFGLLLALNTGTRGFCSTIHADSCVDTLQRVEDLLRLAKQVPIRRTIARFVNLLVFMDIDDQGRRRVADVQQLTGVTDSDEYVLEAISE
jgi:type IV secretion system protein VirB11